MCLAPEPRVAVQLDRVGKSYDGGESFAIRGVSFVVEPGETLVLLGSSGSGKSTVLKSINHLLPPTEGQVFVRGKNSKTTSSLELRRSIGYVAQGISLFPFMTIRENLGLPLRLRRLSRSQQQELSAQALEWVRLPTEFLDRMPQQLSGGQQQRVGVARALLAGADLLLMDEPFGALDPVTRESLQEEVVRLKSELNVTIIFVTHDLFEALALADRIGIMHEGKLEQVGTPAEVMDAPATAFVRAIFEKPRKQLGLFERNT